MKKNPIIVLGVTGGIAAYKSAELCSRLVQNDCEVHVVMTENAARFVTPLTFRTLSQQDVLVSLWENDNWRPGHVSLADVADIFVVAPASADFIAKYTYGIADDALTTFAATFNGKTLLAPAMNPQMWLHAACRENIAVLKRRGVSFCGPVNGRVACGAPGEGRMAEASDIADAVMALLKK